MRNLLMLSFLLVGLCLVQNGFSQTLQVHNNTSQTWSINYYGENVTAPPGTNSFNVSDSDCALDVTIQTNFPNPTCSQTIVQGENEVECAGSPTKACIWNVISEITPIDPCGKQGNPYVSVITFED